MQRSQEADPLQAQEPDELRQRRQLQLLLVVVIDVSVVGIVVHQLGELPRQLVVAFQISFEVAIAFPDSVQISVELE